MESRNIKYQSISDKQMLTLIDILKAHNVIRFNNDFCEAIGLRRQNLTNIKNGINHFTPEHIQKVIETYKVNANWIFGASNTIFLGNKKRHIKEKKTSINKNTVK